MKSPFTTLAQLGPSYYICLLQLLNLIKPCLLSTLYSSIKSNKILQTSLLTPTMLRLKLRIAGFMRVLIVISAKNKKGVFQSYLTSW